MIIGEDRKKVIENIKFNAENQRFHDKVELNDPVLNKEQEKAITDAYVKNRNKVSYRIKRAVAVAAAKIAAKKINEETEIVGLEKIPSDLGGVLITSNHFGPLENTVLRFLMGKLKRKNLGVICQTSNFAMNGAIGFLMNYADTIPISTDPRYLAKDFIGILKERLVDDNDAILLYPEQEMWFNYRKPRPPKSGAYFFASKLSVPILSCFVEIIDQDEDENEEFKKSKYRLHILGLLRPDQTKSTKENTRLLAEQDYALKKECYEKVYGKKLVYKFENDDIAGWKDCV